MTICESSCYFHIFNILLTEETYCLNNFGKDLVKISDYAMISLKDFFSTKSLKYPNSSAIWTRNIIANTVWSEHKNVLKNELLIVLSKYFSFTKLGVFFVETGWIIGTRPLVKAMHCVTAMIAASWTAYYQVQHTVWGKRAQMQIALQSYFSTPSPF